MKVRDPQGQTWRVTRRWVPWRRKVKGLDAASSPVEWATGLGDDPLSAILALLLLVLALPFIILALLVALELLLILLLIPFAALARIAFGRHWIVEARRGYRIWWDAPSGGWRASGERIRTVAQEIERGALPPRTVGDPDPDEDPDQDPDEGTGEKPA